jgi:hypothetical protein
MSNTLGITDNLFDYFSLAFSIVLHKLRNHTNNKGNANSTMSKINETIDQLSIKNGINFGILKSFSDLYTRFKRSNTWITIDNIKMCQNIHDIYRLK